MIKNKWITYILTLVIGIGFLTSVFLLSERHKAEENFKNLEIILSINDLETLANANDKDLEEVILDFKESGATSIIIREKSLGDLERNGELEIVKKPGGVYLDILNKNYSEQVEKNITSKKIGKKLILDGKELLEIPIKVASSYASDEGYVKILDETGIGFDIKQLEIINKTGMMVIPQIRSWKNYNQESIDLLAMELENIDNISLILNNDSSVVGYPGYVDEIIDTLNPTKEIPVGMVEFFYQSGLNSMIYKNDMQTVRIHSISDKEMLNFSEKRAIERYLLSAEERNIRGIFLKLFYLDNPMNSYHSNIGYVETISESLVDSGFSLDKASIIEYNKKNIVFYGIIVLALLAGIGMIFVKLKNPFLGLLGILGAGGLIGALFLVNSLMALKIAALLLVLVYPILAFVSVLQYEEDGVKSNIINALKNTITISVITFAGGLMMASLLSFTPFMIKTNQFAGVKIAHLIPLILIPLILMFWSKEGFANIKRILNMAIEYKVAVLGVIGAAALAYYLLRTGNQGAGLVSGFENTLREFLNNSLGVRPRTKEFLIGYPFLLLLMYLGLNKKTWVLLFPAIIGQISLANTYAHIHTPIGVSLQRSALGLIIGLALGLILIIAWKIMENIYEQYIN